ncbi:hypothetical protein [Streptomyces sp. NPDC005374]|uniref:hypothetical protein n=1 Tax=Streptomyces sp. NPDC005374 TaxID=3364713 RepID=UPI00367A21F7
MKTITYRPTADHDSHSFTVSASMVDGHSAQRPGRRQLMLGDQVLEGSPALPGRPRQGVRTCEAQQVEGDEFPVESAC